MYEILRALSGPLLIEPAFGRLLSGVLARKLSGESFDGARLHAELNVAMPGQRPAPRASKNIAVIPVYGMITQHANSMGTSIEGLAYQRERAMADPNVDAIAYEYDSPGGTVPGVPEEAAKIREAAQIKPVFAIANGMAGSAAYWLASAASEVWLTASGDGVGSIGVYTLHEDISKALEMEGTVITPISYGEHKLEGAPFAPLSDDAKARLQERVDAMGQWFTKDVGTYRGVSAATVRSDFGKGRMLRGKEAVDAGLADKVGSLEDMLAKLATRKMPKGGMSAAARERQMTLDSVK
jgi:signal peptide peptidase SppA